MHKPLQNWAGNKLIKLPQEAFFPDSAKSTLKIDESCTCLFPMLKLIFKVSCEGKDLITAVFRSEAACPGGILAFLL